MQSADFVVTRRRKACLLAPPQHCGARLPTLKPSPLGFLRRVWNPVTSAYGRTRNYHDKVRRWCAVRTARALLAVAVSGLCLVLLPSPAAAAEPVASVAITLTSMEPELPTRDGEITVTGRVTNITKERLYRLEALFWRNQAPILGRAGLEQALTSESNDPLGARYTGAFQDLFTAAEPYLAPNASVDFRLEVKISDLELPPTDGVYLMGVHILQRGNNVAIGRARTF